MNDSREQLESLLSAYVDGELTPQERGEVEAWLARDAQARELLADLQAMHDALHALPRARASSDMTDAVRSRMERQALLGDAPFVPGQARSRFPAIAKWAAAASVALMICAGGYLSWSWTARQPGIAGEPLAALESPAEDMGAPAAGIAEGTWQEAPLQRGTEVRADDAVAEHSSAGLLAKVEESTSSDIAETTSQHDARVVKVQEMDGTQVVTLAFADPQSKRRAVEKISAGAMVVTTLGDPMESAGRLAIRARSAGLSEDRASPATPLPSSSARPARNKADVHGGRELHSSASAPAQSEHEDRDLLELLVLVPDERTRVAMIERFQQPALEDSAGPSGYEVADSLNTEAYQWHEQAGGQAYFARPTASAPALPEDSIVFARPGSRSVPAASAGAARRVQPNAPADLSADGMQDSNEELAFGNEAGRDLDTRLPAEKRRAQSGSDAGEEMAFGRFDSPAPEHLLKLHIRVQQPGVESLSAGYAAAAATQPAGAAAEPAEVNASVLDLSSRPATASAPE